MSSNSSSKEKTQDTKDARRPALTAEEKIDANTKELAELIDFEEISALLDAGLDLPPLTGKVARRLVELLAAGARLPAPKPLSRLPLIPSSPPPINMDETKSELHENKQKSELFIYGSGGMCTPGCSCSWGERCGDRE